MTATAQTPNADIAARFIAASPGRNDPMDVIDAARMALVDTIGVAIGACGLLCRACRLHRLAVLSLLIFPTSRPLGTSGTSTSSTCSLHVNR